KKLVTTDFSNKILSMSSDLLMNDSIVDELINTMKRNYLNREKSKILEEIENLQKENNISLLHDALDNLRDINLRLSESIKEDYNE
ncbi:MAG: DNA primase, partial [Peptoniphilus sp.]